MILSATQIFLSWLWLTSNFNKSQWVAKRNWSDYYVKFQTFVEFPLARASGNKVKKQCSLNLQGGVVEWFRAPDFWRFLILHSICSQLFQVQLLGCALHIANRLASHQLEFVSNSFNVQFAKFLCLISTVSSISTAVLHLLNKINFFLQDVPQAEE